MSEHNGRAAFGGEDGSARGPAPASGPESAVESTLEYPSGLVPQSDGTPGTPTAAPPGQVPSYDFMPAPGPGPDLFPEPEPGPDDHPDPELGLDTDEKAPAKRSRIAIVTVTAATFAVTAGVLVGVSMYQAPTRGDHLQDDLRAGVPDQVSASAERSPGASASTSASASASTSASPSESTSASPTGSPTPSPTASPTKGPATSPTTAPDPTPTQGGAEASRVLRLGDTGPQVRELQLRLKQIGRYDGEATGVYDESVQSAVRTYQFTRLILSDDSGVYGAATRQSLESETQKP
ncbi:peptidoglycan-binding domain-containing protein [Streptomyces acidiscabies]|uniref:peptidoglycan-binding domain-containing protein n=1 Tax=Streptomyces acidiscabies TaxID=42234 RepID=UPI0009523D23|nr:peptidoglycan-binding domain-containing protein [Streptomyces acidiscabies]